jgi:hypothetical protein
MRYCVATPNRALELKPERKWNGSPLHEFRIRGKADSTFASCPTTLRSVGGQTTLLEGAPVMIRSKMESIVALSVTESELISGTECAQDMMYTLRIVKSMGLKVELPMILEIDNKGMVDISNNWSAGGRTRHMNTRYYFLRELKEAGLMRVIWRSGYDMPSDMLTKNLARPLFEKHITTFCGNDEYLKN